MKENTEKSYPDTQKGGKLNWDFNLKTEKQKN